MAYGSQQFSKPNRNIRNRSFAPKTGTAGPGASLPYCCLCKCQVLARSDLKNSGEKSRGRVRSRERKHRFLTRRLFFRRFSQMTGVGSAAIIIGGRVEPLGMTQMYLARHIAIIHVKPSTASHMLGSLLGPLQFVQKWRFNFIYLQEWMAERAGFEPAVRFPVHTLSRRAPSTTRPPLRWAGRNEGAAKLQPVNVMGR